MGADRRGRGPVSWLTLALIIVGTASIELAICGAVCSVPEALTRAAGWAILAGVVSVVVGRRKSDAAGPSTGPETTSALSWKSTAVLVGLGMLPFALEPLRRLWTGTGSMPETMMLESVRNLGLGLAALARRPAFERLAVILALFEVLVGASLVDGPAMTALAGVFAVLGTAWLMAGYWAGLPGRRGGTRTARPPLAGALVSLAAILAVPVVLLVGPATAAMVLGRLLPTSGGNDWPDPDARSGIGDGPNEVEAREDARSVGFSQSELYLDSDQPSLYDAFNDMLGEPYRKTEFQPAVAIDPGDVREPRDRASQDLRAGREFQTHRRPPVRRKPPDQDSDALIYVRGRVPLHIRLVAYDVYEDQTWAEGTTLRGHENLGMTAPGSPWMRVETRRMPYHAGTVSHRIKVARLDTSAVPAPAGLEQFRVGGVNRADFYEWGQPGIVRMIRPIPSATVVDTESRTVHPGRLLDVAIPKVPGYAFLVHREPPTSPIVNKLAASWTTRIPRGWGQVEAIVDHLRSRCEHDRHATAPEDCPDVLAHFLVESGRGPDYLFATAAALMLRSLDIPARVVGGFYADPERYDPISRHTPVYADDAHLWVEVQLPGGVWVPIEPTPGYALMAPALSPLDHLLATVAVTVRWMRRNVAALAMAVAGLAVLLWRRRQVLDAAWTLGWSLTAPRAASRRLILHTLRLIEQRARRAGCARPAGRTPNRWYIPLASSASPGLRDDLRTLLRLADWSLHAPEPGRDQESLAGFASDPRDLCRRIVKGWTLSTFQGLARTQTRPEVTLP